MFKTVENTERSPTTTSEKIIPLTKLLATLTLFFSVVGFMGLTIFSESSAEAEATRPTEPTPAAFAELPVVAAQSKQVTDKSTQTVQAIDEIYLDDTNLVGELQTRIADSAPVVVADDRENDTADIDPDALQVKAADWLLSKNPRHYLIQLRSGTDYKQMNESAYAVAQVMAVDPSQGIVVYPFKSNNKGQTVYGFGIGPYKNATAARNAVSEVPQDVQQQHGTWIRRLDDLQSAVAEINSGEIEKLPDPEPAQVQLEQTKLVSIETVVENPQIEDAQQRNNTESILRTDTNTRDVAFWVETVGVEEIVVQESASQQRNNTESILRTDTNTRDVAFWVETVGVEEIVVQESASKDVAKEETLPDEEPALEQSPDVTPELKPQDIENNQEGPVLEFQPLEFQELKFEQ